VTEPNLDVVGALIRFDEELLRVEKYARSTKGKFFNLVDLDDLRQEMLTVLWQSALSFDPARGVPFSAYLQINLNFTALKVAFPTRLDDLSADAKSLSQEVTSRDGVASTIEDRCDDYHGKEAITNWHASDNFWSRAAELIHLIETSPVLTPTERRYLHLQFVEGLDQPEVVSKVRRSRQFVNDITRAGLKKLRQVLGVVSPDLKYSNHDVDTFQLYADVVLLMGDREKLTLAELADGLNALPDRPWRGMNAGAGLQRNWLGGVLKKWGVPVTAEPGHATRWRPRVVTRVDLRRNPSL